MGFFDLYHFCGCAIISDRWVVTAAYCLRNNPIEELRIRVGSNEANTGGQVFNVEKAIPHPSYEKKRNDIGLIRVQGNITFNDKVKTIQLETNEVPSGTELLVTGWGTTETGDPDDLQQLRVKAISDAECKNAWNVTDEILCTFTKRGEGMCRADSGGPLVRGDKLIGLVSFDVPEEFLTVLRKCPTSSAGSKQS
ncbi:chymotrypsin-2-like [Sitodiplosis mosellana]|uniref:chymotrypsin-2-like n=1 Tax=Sitodiplosis mosellana TaxID=263140 RepID=UPI0024439637|nr:chymotrypsin-2-like [Sitodiplosis mosellana]